MRLRRRNRPTGAEFYDSVLSIADGVATKKPLVHTLPIELTSALVQPPPKKADTRSPAELASLFKGNSRR